MTANTRFNNRQGTMVILLQYIKNHPGCGVYDISDATGIARTEVLRYLRPFKYEFRNMKYMMDLRDGNRSYYNHLLHDAKFVMRGVVEGFMINTSKMEIFDRFCLKNGYNLVVDKRGRSFVTCYEDDPEQRAKIVRVCVMEQEEPKNEDE